MMTLTDCADWLRSRDRFLILAHRRPDGDALGSAAGLCRGLRLLGKTACTRENPEATERYRTWVGEYCAPDGYAPDYILSVDLADEDIIQENARELVGKIDLSIDHHPSNTGYARAHFVMPERASCGEIIYLLLRALGGGLDAETAKLLYVAVTTDTGCFRYKNTTSETLRVGAALLDAGATVDINRRFFMKKRRSRLMLESAIIDGLDFFMDGEACIGTVTLADMARIGVTEEDMEDIAVVAGQVETVETSVTLRQLGPERWKISVRTGNWANANAICQDFGGGGHGMAAGANLTGDEASVKAAIRAAVRRHWKQV